MAVRKTKLEFHDHSIVRPYCLKNLVITSMTDHILMTLKTCPACNREFLIDDGIAKKLPVESRKPPKRVRSRISGHAPKEKRIIRVTKWLGTEPALAVCANCGGEFKVLLTTLAKTGAARNYLEQEFERHKCSSPTTESLSR